MATKTEANGVEFTIEQLEEMIQTKKAQAKAQAPNMMKELDEHCRKKYGMSLMSIVAGARKAPEKKIFVNPQNPSERYEYNGKGKLPGRIGQLSKDEQRAWLQK